MRGYLLILITLFDITICSCQETSNISKVDEYYKNLLSKEKYLDNFEEDSDMGYIKIGKFLNPSRKNAIVVSFDTITYFKVYELIDTIWKLLYQQKHDELNRAYNIIAFIEDYNFDGIKDIGLQNQISNGTTIKTFHLWLSGNNTFTPVPEFQDIGNPVILKKKKIIQGFSACCAFNEMTLSNYYWLDNKLLKASELEISNYSSEIEAHLKDSNEQHLKKIKLSEKDIRDIISKYSENWQLTDTTANKEVWLNAG